MPVVVAEAHLDFVCCLEYALDYAITAPLLLGSLYVRGMQVLGQDVHLGGAVIGICGGGE